MSASGDSSTSRSTSGAHDAPEHEPAPLPQEGNVADCDAADEAVDDICASCPMRRRKCPRPPHRERKGSSGRERRELPHYTLGEEIANSITHGLGVLLAIAGLVLLIVKAALGGAAPTHIASAIVFGVTLILEYLASTLYHAIQVSAAKRIFRTIDHSLSTCSSQAAIRRFA